MSTEYVGAYTFDPNGSPVLTADSSKIASIEVSNESVTTRLKKSNAVMITGHDATISGTNTVTCELFTYNLYPLIINAAREAGVTINYTK